jgi:hypothetical protein
MVADAEKLLALLMSLSRRVRMMTMRTMMVSRVLPSRMPLRWVRQGRTWLRWWCDKVGNRCDA